MLVVHSLDRYKQIIEKAIAGKSNSSLVENLTYLHCYGGLETDPTEMKVDLYPGTELYFDVTWSRKDPTTGEYKQWMTGGLVHHTSDNKWSVHT